jgi:Ca2+-binding EF-hand superfamily protein
MEDFNLIDAFRIFDIDGQGSITSKQIQDGLN